MPPKGGIPRKSPDQRRLAAAPALAPPAVGLLGARITQMGIVDPVQFIRDLVGRELHTVTGRPNRILSIDGERALVATTRSPKGKPVPLEWVEAAVRRLQEDGEVEVSVSSLGYRSAFIGAVLLQVPGARLRPGSPPLVTQR